jgi:Spy/CpxP family protein refolding chaperone
VLTPEQRETAKGYVEDLKAAAAGQEGPEIGPISETIADRLHAAVEKIKLTPEQWTKIREAHAPFAEKHRAQRAERLQLIQEELKSVSEVLTPEQRDKVRSLIEARMVHSPVAQTVAERMHALADRLGIGSEQLTKIRETHRGFADQYDALGDDRDHLLQEELKAVSEILTPEQREKVSNFFADRVVMVGGDLSRLDEGSITQLRETIADRLEGVADKLGLTAEQKEKIKETHAGFIPKYRVQRDKRRELRQKELDALSALLTADQREKVKDFIGDQFELPKGN